MGCHTEFCRVCYTGKVNLKYYLLFYFILKTRVTAPFLPNELRKNDNFIKKYTEKM
ncbi:hypothetical protein AA0313_1535 [Acetobacter indonesiensis NRIC 0313]|uniref:Uncharacterized protein n=1 Tax=Acetobacter indonesiensis TaxID=104101 RepID=A0A6N3T7R3_9PROT|nr:hypothetical protein Abin_085_044 [Acetobacter indonesiensis]GBQ57666.1 hypothetical protein AA0313_1535 [Acetobacter indonesiensis NRIC 0313]GEN03998.1 hypothetical protein AIN02nite_20230 [Acetobacter indonesiensis]